MKRFYAANGSRVSIRVIEKFARSLLGRWECWTR